jgi:hypothetical protein
MPFEPKLLQSMREVQIRTLKEQSRMRAKLALQGLEACDNKTVRLDQFSGRGLLISCYSFKSRRLCSALQSTCIAQVTRRGLQTLTRL